MAKDWRSMREANMISPADFYRTISDTPVDGVTISGGEPFLQSHALACLLKIMHPRNVICFSGYTYEEILQDASKRDLLNVTDILIDGEYDENKNSGSGLRGSYNQKIIQLKNPASGEKQLSAAQLETCPRKMEIITEKDGIMIVVVTLERHSNVILAGPDIVSRGFVYVRESDELMDEARQLVNDTLEELLDKGVTDWGKLKTATKDVLSDYVWKKTKRSPMILPIIMEV